MEEEKPDWILSNLHNAIPPDIDTMRKQGDFVSGFGLRKPDEYWALPDIQAAFTDENNQPQRKLFDDYYNTQKENYMTQSNTELMVGNLDETYANEYAKSINAVGPRAVTLKNNPDPWGRSYTPATGWTDKQRGWRETARNTGVRLADGSYVSPDEFEGYSKFAMNDDGSMKLDEQGRPHMVPIKDGEELKSYEQVYNGLADDFGYYGHDYEMKHVAGFLLKNGLTFLGSALDSAIEFPKTLIGSAVGTGSEAYKKLNNIETFGKSLNWGKTEQGQDFWTFENLSDLGSQVGAQLGGMAGVAKLTTMATKSPIAGSIAGRTFMVGIAAGEISEIAREEGLTPKEQAVLLGLYSTAIYGLAGLSEGVIKGFKTNNSLAAFREQIRPHAIAIKQGDRSFISKVKDIAFNFRSTAYKLENAKGALPQYGLAAGAESLEEAGESVALSSLKGAYNAYNEVFDSGKDKENKFTWNWTNELKNLGHAAVGGAIGGVVAKKMFKSFGQKNPEGAAAIEEMIASGKANVLYKNLDRYHKEGKLGLTWADTDGNVISKEGGDGKISENDAAYNIIKGVIDYNVELYDSLGFKDIYRNNHAAAGETLSKFIVSSSMGKEASILASDIGGIQSRITEEAATLDKETLTELNQELELKRQRLGDIVSGRAVDDYIAQGVYNFSTMRRDDKGQPDPEMTIEALNGKQFVDLHKSVAPVLALEQLRVAEQAKVTADIDKSATLDNYKGISHVGKARIVGESKVNFQRMLTESLPAFNAAMQLPLDSQELLNDDTETLVENLRVISQTPESDPDAIKRATELVQLYDKMSALDAEPVVEIERVPTEDDFYLNMVAQLDSPESKRMRMAATTAIPIREMIDKELLKEKEQVVNGVSMYTNTTQLKEIRNSIRARIAQLKGTMHLRSTVPQTKAQFVRMPEDPNGLLNILRFNLAEVQRLINISEENLSSSELRIRQATIKILDNQVKAYEKFVELAIAKEEFASAKDIFSSYATAIEESAKANDIEGMIRAIMRMETDTYDRFASRRDAVLEMYASLVPEKIDVNIHNSGKYDDVVASYNYIRGVLSLDTTTVLSAYEKAIGKASSTRQPAINQDLIVTRAVQGLFGDKYEPPFYIDAMQSINLANTVMVHSEGGAGKTSQVIPLVAAVIQELEPGSKVFLTSKNNDGGKRIENMRKEAKEYFKSGTGTTLNMVDSVLDIQTFLDPKNVGLHENVNLVVFDEATLLTFIELRDISNKLNQINTQRKIQGKRPMKLLLTGDIFQNNIGANRSRPDTEIHGIGNQVAVKVPTTPELNFSFRSLNQSLKLFNDFVRSSQFKTAAPTTAFITEYEGLKGVRIFNEQQAFNKHVASVAAKLKAKGELQKAVYITDKNKSQISPEIVASEIPIMSSEAAQGNGFQYVFGDPSINNLFMEGVRNLAVKKDFYTMSTRAEQYFATVLNAEQNISSRKGTVYDMKPLSGDQITKEGKLANLAKILDGTRRETENPNVVYSGGEYTIVNPSTLIDEKSDALPEEQREVTTSPNGEWIASFLSGLQNAAGISTDPRIGEFIMNELGLQIHEDLSVIKKAANEWIAKRVKDIKSAKTPTSTPPTQPKPEPKIEEMTADTLVGAMLSNLDSDLAAKGLIPAYTFHTPGPDVEKNIALKKKAIYEINDSYDYFLTIAKLGTEDYHNAVNVGKKGRAGAPGTYAVFIEAYVDGEKVRIGILPDKVSTTQTLDDFVKEKGLIGADEGVARFKLSPRIIRNARDKAAAIMRTKTPSTFKSLGEIKADSKHISFGKPFIFRNTDVTKKRGWAGRPLIPVSFYYNTDQINRILKSGKHNDFISYVPFNYARTTFDDIVSQLQKYVVTDDKGKKYNFSGEGGRMYDAFWGNMAKKASSERDETRFVTLEEAFNELYAKQQPGTEYAKWMSKYTSTRAGVELNPELTQLFNQDTQEPVPSKAKYFLANYLEASEKQKPFFRKAVDDLMQLESYRQGFRFDLVLAKNQAGSAVDYMGAQELPTDIVNQYIETNIDFISPPILKLDAKELGSIMQSAKPMTTATPTVPTRTEPIEMSDEEIMQRFTDESDTRSLIHFQERFFPGKDAIHMRPTLDLFKRTMFDHLFKLRNTETPMLNNLDAAVNAYKAELDANHADITKYGFGTDPERDLDMYKNGVIRNNFKWLLSRYFPAVKQVKGEWVFSSNHATDQSYVDKENFSLLHQGMTDMVKMLIFNTPLISNQGGVLKSAGGYLGKQDVEEIINELKRGDFPHTAEEFARKLAPDVSKSMIANSIYYRWFNPDPMIIDGVPTASLYQVNDEQARRMLNSFRSFFLSGQGYSLVSVNLANGKHNLPLGVFGTPTAIRQHIYESMNAKAQAIGKDVIQSGNSVRIAGKNWMRSRAKEGDPYTNEEVIEAMHDIGLTVFTQETLDSIMRFGLFDFRINPGPTAEQQVRDIIIDQVFFPTARKFKEAATAEGQLDPSVITSYVVAISKSIARRDGTNNLLVQRKLDGKKVYRLRDTAPIFTLQDKIEKLKINPGWYVNNTFLSEYTIDKFYVNEEVSIEINKEPQGKSIKSMFPDEMAQIDILWGFLNTAEKAHANSKEFSTAAFPIMPYSDASTMINVIVNSKSGFIGNINEALKKGFKSQSKFYRDIETDILQKWSASFAFVAPPKSLAELKGILDEAKIPTAEVEKIPGFVVNRHYVNNKGFATIKETLIDDLDIATNLKRYTATIEAQYANFKQMLDGRIQIKLQLEQRIRESAALSSFTPETILRSFFIHWVNISNDIQLLTNGPISDFKGKYSSAWDTLSPEIRMALMKSADYIDMTKRAKSEISTHNVPVLRNDSWEAQYQKFIAEGGTDMKNTNPVLFHEGHKLGKRYNVAYVKDFKRTLISIAGDIKDQEVYDGATLVTPLTRIFQAYSNGHDHGILTPPVMKNITTYKDLVTGVKTFIKNAEFELTTEIIRNGTPMVVHITQQMLGPVGMEFMMSQKDSQGNPMQADFSNLENEHWVALADHLVETGQQNSIIYELVPDTSVKAGRSATTALNEPFIPTQIEITSKGTQLDASKETSEGLWSKAPTQAISSMGVNWMNPAAYMQMTQSLNAITQSFLQRYKTMPDDVLGTELRDIVRKAVETQEGILYVNQLMEKDNFSLDDRQVLNTLISNLSSKFSDEAISVKFRGGHYVVHPSDGLVEVYDTPTGVKIKSQLEGDEKGLPSRPLKWVDPVHATTGESFSTFRENLFRSTAPFPEGVPFEEGVRRLPPDVRRNVQELINAELRSGNWIPGEAEILLPPEMETEFMLEPGRPISAYNRAYFVSKLLQLDPKRRDSRTRGQVMFDAFQKRITGIMSRIPNTGKHSAVNVRVVGFMHGSQNSVFVPSMLLFIQGADQDIDKGTYLTYETINGVMPEVDENFNLTNGKFFSKKKPTKPRTDRPRGDLSDFDYAKIVAYKNKVIAAIHEIISDPKNLVEANVSVDTILDSLRKIRDDYGTTQFYNKYDYTSLNRMVQVNQAGKTLIGIFANGLKAYQNLYAYFKITGKQGALADIDVDFNKVWINFAAFINAATDNAKEQILGTMGINDQNAGMISYLIATGMDVNQINDFLKQNREKLDMMNKAEYHDAEFSFSAEREWGNDDPLTTIYNLGREFRMVGSIIINRGIKPSPDKLYSMKNNIEKWVRDSYKKILPGVTTPFDFVKFMNDDEYAAQHIKLYDNVIANRDEHEFNFLEMIRSVPHLQGYAQTLTTAIEVMRRGSKAFSLAERIADEYRFPEEEGANEEFLSSEAYMSIMDFAYGGLIDAYFNSQKEIAKVENFDLSTAQGRTDFVKWMNATRITQLQDKYPNNHFIQTLYAEPGERHEHDFSRLRTYELSTLEEEALLEMRATLDDIEDSDREMLVKYGMIVDKNRTGKGSWNQLLAPEDFAPFYQFVDSINPLEVEVDADVYRTYAEGMYEKGLAHNAIPYTFTAIKGLTPADNKQEVLKTATHKNLFTIEAAKKQKTFRNYPVEFVDKISSKRGDKVEVAATNFNGKILLNEKVLRKKFKGKAWSTNPPTLFDGSQASPLPVDQFKTFDEFFTFVLLHELKHNDIKILEGEARGTYENRINQAAIKDLNENYKLAPKEDIRETKAVQFGKTGSELIDAVRKILPTGVTMTIKDRNVTFETGIEILSGRGRSKTTTETTVYEFLKNVHEGSRPEGKNLDPVAKQELKAILDYYEIRKNEPTFTRDQTRKNMKECGISIKLK